MLIVTAHPSYLWNKLQAMLITSATFLLESGKYIHSSDTWEETLEFKKLGITINEAVTSICTSATKFFGEDFHESTSLSIRGACNFKTIEGLLWMWPLCIVFKTPGISLTQRFWARGILLSIGQIGRIPKATALVRLT
jgi:hypothetical protein